jgi:acetyl esterase/lipase
MAFWSEYLATFGCYHASTSPNGVGRRAVQLSAPRFVHRDCRGCTRGSGLVPAWLGVGTLDLFHDEIVDYAERLTVAGVPADLQIVPGAFHAFDTFVTKAQVSRNFFGSQCVSLRSAFTPSAPDPSARQRYGATLICKVGQ